MGSLDYVLVHCIEYKYYEYTCWDVLRTYNEVLNRQVPIQPHERPCRAIWGMRILLRQIWPASRANALRSWTSRG